MPTTNLDVDALVNKCIAFISRSGKVTSIPVRPDITCLLMEYHDREMDVEVEVLISEGSSHRLCTIYLLASGGIKFMATGLFSTKANKMRAHLYFPDKWEEKICS